MSSVLMLNSLNYSFADDARSGINFYSGMFDFSDDKKSSQLFGVEHQSPQILLIKDGACVYHTSHNAIDAQVINEF